MNIFVIYFITMAGISLDASQKNPKIHIKNVACLFFEEFELCEYNDFMLNFTDHLQMLVHVKVSQQKMKDFLRQQY